MRWHFGPCQKTQRLRMTMRDLSQVLGAALIVLAISGCGASGPSRAAPDPSFASPLMVPEPAPAPISPGGVAQGAQASPLDLLWESRRSNASDFAMGAGDIIEIFVPGMQDFRAHASDTSAGGAESFGQQSLSEGHGTARVDGLGYIDPPLFGRIHVAGLTEEQLREELTRRLGKYMYDPKVDLAVKSYNSREVAVTGEVHAPGMYIAEGPTETIHDLIIRAGGTSDRAAPKIMLTPANTAGKTQLAAASPWLQPADRPASGSSVNDAASPDAAADGSLRSTYVIDLTNRQMSERYLNIPVRPGDTVYVPKAGSVTVIGWVYSPKTIDVTPGLTVLSAVSDAGGPLFAADVAKIKIIRQQAGRQTSTLTVNLDDIKAARAQDVAVQADDIIEVPYSAIRIPGYAVYYGVQGLVNMAPTAFIFSGGS